MAGQERMTTEEVVRQVLLDEHADVLRASVRWLAEQIMELEVSELIGAERGERRPQDRATHRNGYRARRLDTRHALHRTNDEWLVGRGYLSAESISLVLAGRDDHTDKEIKEEVRELQAA